jgi:hypothetical protein
MQHTHRTTGTSGAAPGRKRKRLLALGSRNPGQSCPQGCPEHCPQGEKAETSAPEVLGNPLSIQEAASLIGCSVWTVRQRCLRQGLPHFRASRTGRLIFYRNQVIRWLIEIQTERRW